MRLDKNPEYQRLTDLAEKAKQEKILDYFDQDPHRIESFSINAPHVFADLSKNLISNEVRDALVKLTENAELKAKTKSLFAGEAINYTEKRPALHTALRALSKPALRPKDAAKNEAVVDALVMIKSRVKALHSGEWLGSTGKRLTQLVSIGIGGSYLGPKTVIEGLKHVSLPDVETFFISNIDGSDAATVLDNLNPETSLFLIQSKSFTTLETLENALVCVDWLKQNLGESCDISKHLLAVSSNIDKAVEFGLAEENIFPMWDWVGGRYSLWSAIGFPIVFQLGYDAFSALLKGAEDMDDHFYNAEPENNLPLMLGLVGIWNRNFLGHASYAVIPYDQQLRFLPEHLQQLDMESNGKTVDSNGEAINYASGPIIFGGAGTNGQHAYHQLFHQGRGAVPVDFIVAKRSPYEVREHHAHLVANCLAQSRALMAGRSYTEALDELIASGLDSEEAKKLASHKVIAGNKPSNTLVIETPSPEAVGALIAMYEHKIFVQGVIWDVNSFDQWGVELGKVLEKELFPYLSGKQPATEADIDPSTLSLLQRLSSK